MSHSEHNSTKSHPVKLVVSIFLGLIALVVGIIMLAYYAIGGYTIGARNEKAIAPAEVAKRIAPVVSLEVDPSKAVAPAAAPAAVTKGAAASAPVVAAVIPVVLAAGAATKAAGGEGVYNSACVACHGTGIAGAPKAGDKAAWAARAAQGKETLYQHAVAGFQGKAGVMPAKGGNSALSDADVKSAVDYMLALNK